MESGYIKQFRYDNENGMRTSGVEIRRGGVNVTRFWVGGVGAPMCEPAADGM